MDPNLGVNLRVNIRVNLRVNLGVNLRVNLGVRPTEDLNNHVSYNFLLFNLGLNFFLKTRSYFCQYHGITKCFLEIMTGPSHTHCSVDLALGVSKKTI